MNKKTSAPTDKQALAAPVDKPALQRRLPPALRVQQILDNALLEFEGHGFQAARMETIAQRSGLSKGGLYAHFDSKEQLFEALLTRSIAMPDVKQMDLTPPVTVRQGMCSPPSSPHCVADKLSPCPGEPPLPS